MGRAGRAEQGRAEQALEAMRACPGGGGGQRTDGQAEERRCRPDGRYTAGGRARGRVWMSHKRFGGEG